VGFGGFKWVLVQRTLFCLKCCYRLLSKYWLSYYYITYFYC